MKAIYRKETQKWSRKEKGKVLANLNLSNAEAWIFSYSANADMNAALNGIVDSLITTELVDYDTITKYIAENGAKQQTISNLINSAEIQGHNLRRAVGQIEDLDVAKESVNKARYDILQDAGTAILA